MFFGMIMAALGYNAVVSETAREIIEDEESREDAINKGKDLYRNHKGQTLHVKDKKPAVITNIKINGEYHEVLKYAGTDHIIKDYTEENMIEFRKKNKEFAEKIGASVYLYDKKFYCDNDGYYSDRVKDLKTGDIYFIRDMDIMFYIDVKTGKYIRPSDIQILYWKYFKYFDEYNYKDSKSFEYIEKEFLSKFANIKNPGGRPSSELRNDDFFQNFILPKMKKLGINKIYKEGETWDSIKHEFLDIGLPENYTKEERLKVLRAIREKQAREKGLIK